MSAQVTLILTGGDEDGVLRRAIYIVEQSVEALTEEIAAALAGDMLTLDTRQHGRIIIPRRLLGSCMLALENAP